VKNIILIGGGQLGSRHLQALVRMNRPARITVVDPCPKALSTCRSRAAEINGHERHQISYQTSGVRDSSIDLAIIATSADIRRSVVEELLASNRVLYVVLEKVLFQSAHDCEEVGHLLRREKISAWVNAPRRMWPFYKGLKESLQGEVFLSVRQSAGNWGLACNTYHYLDLTAYLCGKKDVMLFSDLLHPEVFDSKRPGFKELSGMLCGTFKDGPFFSVCDYRMEAGSLLMIETDRRAFSVNEVSHKIHSISGVPLPDGLVPAATVQSHLTDLVAEEIFEHGACSLTPYDEAEALHRQMLKAFAAVFCPGQNRGSVVCPIT